MEFENVLNIYSLLLKTYGEQGWWPVISENKIQYGVKTFNHEQKLEVMIGAILTQNTSWKNVEKSILNLNSECKITIENLSSLSQEKLSELIRPSGYCNKKSLYIKELLVFLKKYPIDLLEKLPFAELRSLFLSIKGIGNETADSIILYALNRPVFVIDAYTKLFCSRYFGLSIDIVYDELQKMFHQRLDLNIVLYKEFHALLVKHCREYCKKTPNCQECFLKKSCNYCVEK